jgi:imidazolonepropionase-like amidohydrolase
MLKWFHSADGQSFRDTLTGGMAVPNAAALVGFERGPFRRVRLVVGGLARKDANFLFGTDTPSMPSYGNLPGLNGYLEMRQLRKAGLSLQQILQAATINNARMLRVDSLGTIEPGKLANLLLLGRSPLESVDAYDSILTVWVHGTAIPREALAAP